MRTLTRWTAIAVSGLCLLLAGAAPVTAAPAATTRIGCGVNGYAIKTGRVVGPCLGQTKPAAAAIAASPATWTVAVTVHATAGIAIPRQWTTTSGFAWQIEIGTNAGSALVTITADKTGAGVVGWDTGKLGAWPAGTTHHVTVKATQAGTGVDMVLTIDGKVTTLPAAFPGMTLGQIV